MSERVYPSAKTNGTAAGGGGNQTNPTAVHPPRASQFAPPTKPHLYNPARHPYRPTPTSLARHDHRRCSCRRCCFLFCCWFILFLIFIILLACIAVAAVYFIYRPKSPAFSISSMKISQFNLTTTPDDSTRLTTKLNLTLSCKNPNKKLQIFYDPITIKSINNDVIVANGSFPSFTSLENNVTIIHTTLSMSNQVMDADSVTALKSDLKRKNGVPMKLVLETRVKLKMEKVKVRKFGISVTCEGIRIRGLDHKGKDPVVASTANSKCKVDLKFKIWKITL